MTPLSRAKVYRNVELRQQWLGLDLFDLVLVAALFTVLLLVNRRAIGWHVLVVGLAIAGLRLIKRGKPEGYTTTLVCFYFVRKPFFSAAATDTEGAAHPFLPSEKPPLGGSHQYQGEQ